MKTSPTRTYFSEGTAIMQHMGQRSPINRHMVIEVGVLAVHGQCVCSDQNRSDKLLVFIVHRFWMKVEDDGASWSDKLVTALLANVLVLTYADGTSFLITYICNLATR